MTLPLSKASQWTLFLLSFLIVAFGQPAWSGFFSFLAGFCGFALFFRYLLSVEKGKHRFWLGTLWFFAVQAVQLSWFVSHPFLYIVVVWLTLSFGCGLQFGCLSLLMTRRHISRLFGILAMAGLWTIMEWLRLFFLSGFSWNPSGMALTWSLYPLQMASLGGLFGLSFWVLFVNLIALRAWVLGKGFPWVFLAAAFPYLFGFFHLQWHERMMVTHPQKMPFGVVLVQPSFGVEESMHFHSPQEAIAFVEGEWKQILTILKKQQGKRIELIVLPEFVVPYGTYHPIFRKETILEIFQKVYGEKALVAMPPLEDLYEASYEVENGSVVLVNNAFILQTIANLFHADVIAGLEDAEDLPSGERLYYSAAVTFHPYQNVQERYEKRVLVPMGEYIPFSFCKTLAASYGITGSFTHGVEAKVCQGGRVPYGCSICYEETFGDLMRENRIRGAELLVNLTSDVWYPHSKLPKQHFDHARLRTLEGGIPLVRACNTGLTCAVDSLGRMIASLDGEDFESIADSLYVEVPTYHYRSFYSYVGDFFVVGVSFLLCALYLGLGRKRSPSDLFDEG